MYKLRCACAHKIQHKDKNLKVALMTISCVSVVLYMDRTSKSTLVVHQYQCFFESKVSVIVFYFSFSITIVLQIDISLL